MKIGQQIKFVVVSKQANSLHSLIADRKFRATSLGRNTWKSLVGTQASLKRNCFKKGLNVECSSTSHSKARVGILGNDQNDCGTCNSRIGFGVGGKHNDTHTCGNQARYSADNGDKMMKAMGYILVQ